MTIDPSLTEYERKFYGDALDRAKTGYASTGYGQDVNQRVRFETFHEAWGKLSAPSHQAFSVLDVGCGTGDLLDYMREAGIPLDSYVGVDRDERMIETAIERWRGYDYPQPLHWVVGDALTELNPYPHEGEVPGRYDIVVSIAALALKPEDWHLSDSFNYAADQIWRMGQRSTRMTFVTLFSTWKNKILPTEMVLDPATMLNWAMTKWPRVDLLHSYAPFDFSLAIYHEEGTWWRNYESQS